MFQSLGFHSVAAIAVLLLLLAVRILEVKSHYAAKAVLAAVPLSLLVSADRIATVVYEPFAEDTGLFSGHPTRGWTSRPGWIGQYERVSIRINSRGFRGPEIPLQKAADERRILFLGDSVTFAGRVAEETCFVTRVERLAAQRHEGARISTINASVTAYSPWQELDLLRKEALGCDPDYAVHVFCLNDVLEKYQLVQFGGYSYGFEPPPQSVFEWSGVFRAARAWRASLQRIPNEELWRLRAAYSTERLWMEPGEPDVQQAWRKTLENMDAIVAVARREALPLVLVCMPVREQFSFQEPKLIIPQAKLAAFASERDIPFLDLLPALRDHVAAHGVEPSDLFFDSVHLTPPGHEAAAVAIYEFLAQQGWLD